MNIKDLYIQSYIGHGLNKTAADVFRGPTSEGDYLSAQGDLDKQAAMTKLFNRIAPGSSFTKYNRARLQAMTPQHVDPRMRPQMDPKFPQGNAAVAFDNNPQNQRLENYASNKGYTDLAYSAGPLASPSERSRLGAMRALSHSRFR